MADLAVGDVTVNLVMQDRTRKRRMNDITIAFGDGSKTYPTNGVPLPTSMRSYGLSRAIERFFLQQPASGGIVYTYDPTNHTIRMWRSAGFTPSGTVAAPVFTGSALASHDHNLKFIGGIAETEAVMIAGGDTLGKNAATDRTIAGADSATKGGVVGITAGTPAGTNSAPAFTGAAVAAAALAEFSGAVTAVTLKAMVKGV